MKDVLTIALIFGFFNLFGQERCDTVSNQIWTVLENPPQMNLSKENLEEKLNISLKKDLGGLENVSFIYALYYVNCNGEDYKYQIATLKNGKTVVDSTSQFSESIINLLKEELQFEPGYFEIKKKNKIEKKTVDFQGSLTIRFDESKFHILDEKELQKHFKKKKKKK